MRVKFVLIACSLFVAPTAIHAVKDSTHRPNMSVGVELFQPLLSPADMQYNADQWQLNSSNDFLQHYNPVAYGVNAQVKSGNFIWGLRAGMTMFNFDESGGFSIALNNTWSYRNTHNHYRQNQFQFALSAKAVHRMGRFGLGIGAELPVIFYQSGERSQEVEVRQNFPGSNDVYSRSTMTTSYNPPSGSTAGIGALIELSYMLGDRFSVAVSLRDYLLYTKYAKDWNMTYSNWSATYKQDGTFVSPPSSYTSTYAFTTDSKQLAFSRISTVLSLAYHFHTSSRLRLKGM